MKNKAMGIYIHIPFCIRKCKYCDFLSFPSDEGTYKVYKDKLIEEIRQYKDKSIDIPSIFFGGGTPSILPPTYIEEILTTLRDSFSVLQDAEITLECNPGTLTKEKLLIYKASGVNRLSIGLQSTNDTELKSLGRIHSYKDFIDSYTTARACGFDNINIDIMSALPYQTLDSYKDTLNKVLSLKPEHISSYSLILEEGTPFYDMYALGNNASLPDEDAEREMYYLTDSLLKEHGYYRYEISNYSKPGLYCKHNTLYWKRGEYFGFGLGASAFYNNTRYKNLSELSEYLSFKGKPIDKEETEHLSVSDAMEEFMFLGLRMVEGISKNAFFTSFGVDIYSVYGKQLEIFKQQNLISEIDDNIRLTVEGIDVSNYIFSEFIM